MKIQPKALERIAAAQISGEKLASLFQLMADQANAAGGVCNNYTIDYEHADQEVDNETWIPQLVLVLRPAQQ